MELNRFISLNLSRSLLRYNTVILYMFTCLFLIISSTTLKSDHDLSYIESSPLFKAGNSLSATHVPCVPIVPQLKLDSECETWSKECSEQVISITKETGFVEWIKSVRRKIHEHPELAFEEYQTSQLVRDELVKLGISFRFPLAVTGIRATIGMGAPPYVTLRADMDALAIQIFYGALVSMERWESKL